LEKAKRIELNPFDESNESITYNVFFASRGLMKHFYFNPRQRNSKSTSFQESTTRKTVSGVEIHPLTSEDVPDSTFSNADTNAIVAKRRTHYTYVDQMQRKPDA
jgi:hypothetical protein